MDALNTDTSLRRRTSATGRHPISAPTSGAGIAICFHPRRLNPSLRHLRIGVVGLGTGTLASYGEEGDYFQVL